MLHIKIHLVRDLWTLGGFGRLGEEEEGCRANQHQADENPLNVRHVYKLHLLYDGMEKNGRCKVNVAGPLKLEERCP